MSPTVFCRAPCRANRARLARNTNSSSSSPRHQNEALLLSPHSCCLVCCTVLNISSWCTWNTRNSITRHLFVAFHGAVPPGWIWFLVTPLEGRQRARGTHAFEIHDALASHTDRIWIEHYQCRRHTSIDFCSSLSRRVTTFGVTPSCRVKPAGHRLLASSDSQSGLAPSEVTNV